MPLTGRWRLIRWICLALWALLLVLAVVYRPLGRTVLVSGEEPSPQGRRVVGCLSRGHTAAYEFSTPAAGLCGLDIQWATYRRRNQSTLKLELLDAGSGRILRSTGLKAADVPDWGLSYWRFEPIRFSRNRLLKLRLSSPEAGVRSCLALLAVDQAAGSAGRFSLDGKEIPGGLPLILWARPPLSPLGAPAAWLVLGLGLVAFLWLRPSPEGRLRLPTRAGLRNWVLNLTVVLAAVLVCGLLGEAVLRIIGPPGEKQRAEVAAPAAGEGRTGILTGRGKSVYRPAEHGVRLSPSVDVLIKNHAVSGRTVRLRTNRLGHRGEDLPARTGDEFRILVLGDSITLAEYLPEEETYVGRLAALAGSGRARTIRVVNAGVASNDLEAAYHILLETGLRVEPDLVLVGLYLNDADPSAVSFPHQMDFFPLNRSRLIQWVCDRLAKLASTRGRGKDEAARQRFLKNHEVNNYGDPNKDPRALNNLVAQTWFDWGYAWSEEAWLKMGRFLAELQNQGRAHGFRTAVVLFPVKYQVTSEYLDDTPQTSFEQVRSRLNLPGLDLLPVLRRAWRRDGPARGDLFYDQCHLTPWGNLLVAQAILGFLDQAGLLPPVR